MRRPHYRPEPVALGPHRVVLPIRVDPSGAAGPTRAQSRGPYWRQSSSRLFVPSDVSADAEQRIVEAAQVLPRFGGVTGWAGLRWGSARWFDGLAADGKTQRSVTLAVAGSNVRAQPGISVSEERLAPADVVELNGLRVTSLVRSACFEMRYAPSARRAVVVLDMAAYDDLVSIAELGEYASRHSGWTGIPQCRAALPLADENSWSPREVLMRLVWTIDAGCPRPLCNVPIFDQQGNHLGTPDLFDPEFGVVGEYDGGLHLAGAQRAKDVRREEGFRSHGLEYVTMLAADSRDPGHFVQRLHAAYDRAKIVPLSRRLWVIEQPSWWVDTSTVERRRALSADQRRRWLRLRAS